MSREQQLPLSFSIVAVMISVLLIATRVQLSMSTLTRDAADECRNKDNYFATYDSINPGFQMLDALGAQEKFIFKSEVSH